MTYKHIEVTEVVRYTALRIADSIPHVTGTGDTDAGIAMIDGLQCTAPLVMLAKAIRKTNRHVKFGVVRDVKYMWSESTYMELIVYMEGDTYAMARIGYADYSVGDVAKQRKFMVASRIIGNEKYRDNRKEYHMAMTDTLERAVKNVNKYMRRYPASEVAAISYEQIRHKLRAPASAAVSNMYDAKRVVREHPHLQTELLILLDSGYNFLSYELRDAITQMRDTQKAYTGAISMNKVCYFVTVRLQSEDMMCDVVRLHSYEDIKDGTDPTVVYKMEELPEELAGRIAVLSMVEDDQYVDNVGLRVNSSTFWVHA